MARKPKYSESTDVVSVRLPVSLIEKLDGLCGKLRTGRAEFFVDVLRRYPALPLPMRPRILVANLSVALIGGGMGVLVAYHTGDGGGLAPARRGVQPTIRSESYQPGLGGGVVAPLLPLRDPRLDPDYRWGRLQYAIPRRPETPPTGAQ